VYSIVCFLGVLVWHSLRHWAYGFSYRRGVVSLRDAALTKQRRGWRRKVDVALMVEVRQ